MRSFITGGAGFIGSHLVDELISLGDEVTVYDNLSAGTRENVNPKAQFVKGDICDSSRLLDALIDTPDRIFHLAASTDIQYGASDTSRDMWHGVHGTHEVLEAARSVGVAHAIFASSATVYGDHNGDLCHEDTTATKPISLYGASKLAAESYCSAYEELFGIKATICRFGNVVGSRLRHGVMWDFLTRLKIDASRLEVFGDGKQTKPYLHVLECVRGILVATAQPKGGTFNIAPQTVTSVETIANFCVDSLPGTPAAIVYKGGAKGWLGDVPHTYLSSTKLAQLGFRTELHSDEAAALAVKEIARDVFG